MTLLSAPHELDGATAADPRFDLETVDRLLTTTRTIRRRLDLERPVERHVIEECLQLAVHAPSANNMQTWRWLVVTDDEKRERIAELYRWAWQVHSAAIAGAGRRRSRAEAESHRRTFASAQWLADNLALVPVHVIPCVVGKPPDEEESRAIERGWQADFGRALGPSPRRSTREPRSVAGLLRNAMYFGSIFPAVWSFQLALRSRGLGSCITMVHLPFEQDVADILKIPSLVTQICLLPVAYVRGPDLQPAPRRSATSMTYWNGWNET